MPRITAQDAGGANVCAFLDMLAWSEIGEGLMTQSTDWGYRVLVGSTPTKPLTFASYATHPAVYNRAMKSTAAGRYQLLSRYFAAYKAQLRLPDFSPISQDRIAIQQIKECHALPLIQAGNVDEALKLCAHIWASLPDAGYGQHENALANLVTAYTMAGGVVA